MPIIAASLFVAAGSIAYSQDQNASDKYVTKEEYQKLKQELEALKAQIQRQQIPPAAQVNAPAADTQALKAKVDQLEKKQAQQQTDNDQSLDQMDKDLKGWVQKTKAAIPGSTHMLIGGYGSGTFEATRGGFGPSQAPGDAAGQAPRPGNSFFTATFNPIFLWQITDRLFFEGELELELASADAGVPTGATTALEMAQMSYLVNDYMTIGAGKFLNPMDYFVERQHMAWVNKLPDKPLAVYDGLLPETMLGVQVRGGIPVGPTKLAYAFYVANSPTLTVADSGTVATMLNGDVGTLGFDQFDNNFGHIATGGRVGFSPIPELEIGYGFQVSAVGPPGSNVGSLLQSADLTYVKDSDLLKGIVNFHAQWVWSHIDAYGGYADATPVPLGPFNNNRNGGYVELAYRPSKVTGFLKNLEPVLRYDMINQMNTPIGFDERRWSAGLNYWLGPSTVVKAAYEIDHQNGIGQSGDAFILQFAVGF
ncbi:MAG: hypothetical protein ACYDH9_02735 [Limisphaerales bacterium]